ncbi:MAG: tetratricopeptide repeat protein [Rickettsiales bacterium]|jgi:tetratricopeptide (TPR) repeat protein|nr:tetratricopeptide repeat protein [Rickettsiales bacterium]
MKSKKDKTISSENDNMEMGKFYFINNKFKEAIEMFNKVIKKNPLNAEAYYNIGIIKEHSNDIEGAKAMYLRALYIDKDYKIAKDKFNKLMGLDKDE